MPENEKRPAEPEATPSESRDAADAGSAPIPVRDKTTPGDYTYEVVDDDATTDKNQPTKSTRGGAPWWLIAVAAIIPALIVGVTVWFFVGGGDNGGGDNDSATTNLLHTFTSGGEDTITTRYEGETPPGYPEELPEYGGADIVASVLQVQGEDAGFIVVSDTSDSRDDVIAALRSQFDEDPWQITAGSDDRESTAYQFSKTDDPDLSGIVLITSSKEGDRTTIVTSVQQVAGAPDDEDAFEPAASRNRPEGFPEEIPAYDGAVLINSSFQNDPQGDAYVLSYITRDDAETVLDYYRDALSGADLTVEDGDASASTLADAQAITFADAELLLQGDLIVGEFPEDENYTQIDIQLGDER